MNKVKEEYKEEAKKIEKPSPKEVLSNLKQQYNDHSQKSKHHGDMALKALGAIEVLQQLEEQDEG